MRQSFVNRNGGRVRTFSLDVGFLGSPLRLRCKELIECCFHVIQLSIHVTLMILQGSQTLCQIGLSDQNLLCDSPQSQQIPLSISQHGIVFGDTFCFL